MKRQHKRLLLAQALACAVGVSATADAGGPHSLPNLLPFPNASGLAATFSTQGGIDLDNPFFKSLGTNGRSCATCHQPSTGWTITPANVRARFDATRGTDPIFRTNDGSTSPLADVSTPGARRKAYAMLLERAVIRVGIGIPATAEFELAAVDDPYGYASATELSLFRRPLPSANLAFLNTVMWDGRETFQDPASHDCILGTTTCFASLQFDLADQANSATLGHAQSVGPLSDDDQAAIVRFESGLFTAQLYDDAAGLLTAHRGNGGPRALSQQAYHFGVNDVLSGDYATGAPFDPRVFTLYDNWAKAEKRGDDDDGDRHGSTAEARAAVVRGQALFNGKTIHITGVGGQNDDLHVPQLDGTCTTCHDTPGAGDHSIPMPLNLGIADASRRTPDMPLYTLRNKATGATVQTTDPGRALITGKWKDVGRFKGPVLRALASRAPYFHDGSAASLDAAVAFYDQRFGIGFTDQEKRDLVAFLRTL